MALTIPIAHDFICPWCWVGVLQAKRLRDEFDLNIEWRGFELFPDELEWPDFTPGAAPPANKPVTPTRFEFLLLAEDLTMPTAERPKKMRTHYAHEAVEYAKHHGDADRMVETLYRAYWQKGQEINDPNVLGELAAGIVKDLDDFSQAIEERRYKDAIVGFDDDAYAMGVYNVPTFFIGDERYAEQPYSVLKKAVLRL